MVGLGLCLQVEGGHFLGRKAFGRGKLNLKSCLLQRRCLNGKAPCSTWPPCLTKLWLKKHLDHWDMLKLFNFVLYNGLPLHILYQSWLKVPARCSI